MKDEHLTTMLEAGIGLVAAGLLAGLATIVFGRVFGDLTRGKRHAEAPPASGLVPNERHQQIGTSSPR